MPASIARTPLCGRERTAVYRQTAQMRISRETLIIAAVGAADLLTTMAWVGSMSASEANPLFRYYLNMGPMWFVSMKVILLAAPLFVLEWARRRDPAFTRSASRVAIGAYLGLYGMGFVRLNPQILQAPASRHTTIAARSTFDQVDAAIGSDGVAHRWSSGGRQGNI